MRKLSSRPGTLQLIRTKSGLLLQGSAPGEELEYFDLDGEGGPASQIGFAPWNEDVEYLPFAVPYDLDDPDTFWDALQQIEQLAKEAGMELS